MFAALLAAALGWPGGWAYAAPSRGAAAGEAAASPSAAALAGAVALTGGALAQQQQLAQTAQAWQQQLANLAAEARRQGDSGLFVVVGQVNGQLQPVATFPPTVAGFIAALQAVQNALNLWRDHPAATGDEELQELAAAETGAGDLSTAQETGFVFAADLTSGAAWQYEQTSAVGGGDEPEEPADGVDAIDSLAMTATGEPMSQDSGGGDRDEGDFDEDVPDTGLLQVPLPAGTTAAAPAPGALVIHGGSAGQADMAEIAELAGPATAAGVDPAFAMVLDSADEGTGLSAADDSMATGQPAGALVTSAALAATAAMGATDAPPAWPFALARELCDPWRPPPAPAAACLLRPSWLDPGAP